MIRRKTESGNEYAITGRVILGDALSTAEPDQVSAVIIVGRPYVDEFRTALIEWSAAA